MASTLGALLDGSIAHLLTLLEMTGTLFTQIFVCRHGNLVSILDNRKKERAPRVGASRSLLPVQVHQTLG